MHPRSVCLFVCLFWTADILNQQPAGVVRPWAMNGFYLIVVGNAFPSSSNHNEARVLEAIY